MEKIIISSFTDPMMGLSYESEPVFRKLETHFAGPLNSGTHPRFRLLRKSSCASSSSMETKSLVSLK